MPAPAAVATAKAIAKSAKTVVVASKLPQSIYIQRSKPVEKMVPGRFGSEKETTFVHWGRRYVIRGTAVPSGSHPKGYVAPTIKQGVALTYDIDAEWFAAWMEEHQDDEWVQGGLLYADPVENNVLAWAREHADVKSGLEPIDPEVLDDPDPSKKDPRLPRPMNAGVSLSNEEPQRAA